MLESHIEDIRKLRPSGIAVELVFYLLDLLNGSDALTVESLTVTLEIVSEVGRWMSSTIDGEPAVANEKTVFYMVSPSEVYSSISRVNENRSPWHAPSLTDFTIDGNVITFTSSPREGIAIIREYDITEISDNEFTANFVITHVRDGEETSEAARVVTFVRINDDYSSDIVGTWEGSCTSEGSVFDDGQLHRWEYHDDGTTYTATFEMTRVAE